MKYNVFITSKAKTQLLESATWWSEKRDIAQAAGWLEGFERAIKALSDNPQRYALARENDLYDLPYPVRQLNYGLGSKPTHRAVFEIRGDTVFVVAIRHLAQNDIPAHEL